MSLNECFFCFKHLHEFDAVSFSLCLLFPYECCYFFGCVFFLCWLRFSLANGRRDCYHRLRLFHFIFGIDSSLFIHAAIENLLREHRMCGVTTATTTKISQRKPHCHSALKVRLSKTYISLFAFFFCSFSLSLSFFLFFADHFNLVFYTNEYLLVSIKLLRF